MYWIRTSFPLLKHTITNTFKIHCNQF